MDRIVRLAETGGPVDGSGSLLFIGTATVLLRVAGFTVLTDPNFLHQGEVVRLGYGLRSRRRTNPACELTALPPLDLVVLSHRHEDHFDRVAERGLDHDVPVATTPSAARALQRRGFWRAEPLATWQSLRLERGAQRLIVTALPARHGPAAVAPLMPETMGSLLEFQAPGRAPVRIYVSGDTLVHDALHLIPRRFPDIDLALLHLGGTRVLGVLVTMDGKQGVEALRIVNPKRAVPIHYDDYEVFKSPLEEFQREVRRAGLEERVQYLHRGDTLHFELPALRGAETEAELHPS